MWGVTLKNHLKEVRLFNRRTLAFIILITVLTTALVVRLFFLQIENHELYTALSEKNQFDLVPLPPIRGLIYDRNGVLLAKNIPTFSLEIFPAKEADIKQTIFELQKIINISDSDIQQFYKQMSQYRRYESIPLKFKLSEIERAKFSVDQFRFPGAIIKARLIREYPMGANFSEVVGYVGRMSDYDYEKIDRSEYAATNFIGKVGIERSFEAHLHGKVGYQQVETDASGRVVRILKRTPPVSGNDLYLTIDSRLQKKAKALLKDYRGAFVAIQPQTGEVLALVTNPSYDPNAFVQGISQKQYQELQTSADQPLYNRALQGIYPLASTVKPFIAVEGLQSKVITAQYEISDPGWFQLPNSSHLYHDWQRGHGVVNIYKAIMVSCDTFFYNLAAKLGIEQISKSLNRFGFGKVTGIDLPGERSGVVPTPEWKIRTQHAPWYLGDTVVAGIGQGYLSGTPLQMAMATAALANRGELLKPIIIHQYQRPDQQVIKSNPVLVSKINAAPPVWDVILNAMYAVAAKPKGTAYRVFGEVDYLVAAKTGTAQVVRTKYDKEGNKMALPRHLQNHSLFIAFAPINKPEVALAVVVENESAAAAIARRFLDFYFKEKKRKHKEERS